jgi:hypothetical protein
MATFFEKGLPKKEILKQVGNIHQIAGAQLFEFRSGKAKGASGLRVRNGLGLDFTILPENGLDIFDIYHRGTPLSWISSQGVVCNQHFDERGTGWLKSFAGGMLVTCGLRNVGPPVQENGENFGLHGNYTSLPAENLMINESWNDNHFHIEVSGKVSESRVFGAKLVNYRSISVSSRNNVISIKDRIVNEGFEPEPLMILYHFNWGSPLFGPDSKLNLNPVSTELRDKDADSDSDSNSWNSFLSPQAQFEEQVYLHHLKQNSEGRSGYELFNSNINMGVHVEWDHAALPCFTQWLMCGEGEYVLGLEPGNCFPNGREKERNNNRLEVLPSFAEKEISLTVEVI